MKKGSKPMSSYAKFAADAGDEYLATLAEAQKAFLKSVEAFSARAGTAPAAALAAIPTPQEVSEASFAFSQKLLKQQKEFADKLFAAAPTTP
jgi:hypothetical protein